MKRDKYICCECGVKQSTRKGGEQKVEVHHLRHIDWDLVTDYIYRHVLVDPRELETLCPECHKNVEAVQITEGIL